MPEEVQTLRIAMWSGPRNISTAMMRAWENRPDTAVWDEPFYAHYLLKTGFDHPMRDDIIAAGETDARRVIPEAVGAAPGGMPIFYQKHMTHHLTADIGLDWLDQMENCFLIREPKAVIASYAHKRGAENISADDLGFRQQFEIFEHVRRVTGKVPPVIDAADVLKDPGRTLAALCEALGVSFTEDMLTWPPGLRDSDGVWAEHWYDSVRGSTGFAPYQVKKGELPALLQSLADEADAWYHNLRDLSL